MRSTHKKVKKTVKQKMINSRESKKIYKEENNKWWYTNLTNYDLTVLKGWGKRKCVCVFLGRGLCNKVKSSFSFVENQQ